MMIEICRTCFEPMDWVDIFVENGELAATGAEMVQAAEGECSKCFVDRIDHE